MIPFLLWPATTTTGLADGLPAMAFILNPYPIQLNASVLSHSTSRYVVLRILGIFTLSATLPTMIGTADDIPTAMFL